MSLHDTHQYPLNVAHKALLIFRTNQPLLLVKSVACLHVYNHTHHYSNSLDLYIGHHHNSDRHISEKFLSSPNRSPTIRPLPVHIQENNQILATVLLAPHFRYTIPREPMLVTVDGKLLKN